MNTEKETDLLLSKRRVFRGQVTRKCQHLTDLLQEPNPPTTVRVEINALMINVQSLIDQLDNIHGAIEHTFQIDELEDEIINYDEYKLKFQRVTALFEINSVNTAPAVNRDSAIMNGDSIINLPKIDIEVFDGNFENWASFWDSFESTFHNHPRMSEVNKLKYLRSFLKDEPLKRIKNYELSPTGYQAAVEQLKREFGKPEKIKNMHLKAIHTIEPVQSMDDVKRLKQLESDLRMHALELIKRGVDVDNLVIFVIDKIPKLLYQLFKQRFPETIALMDLLNFIRTETESMSEWEEAQKPQRIKDLTFTTKTTKSIPTASVLTASSTGDNSKRAFTKFYCVICGSHEHSSRVCNADLTLKEKKDILLAKGRCLKCLRTGHNYSACDFNMQKCRRCDEEHFQALCPGLCRTVNNTLPDKPVQSTSNYKDKMKDTTFNNCDVENVTSYDFLLCTTVVKVQWGNQQITTLCLIDSGSQRSVISQELANELNLPTVGQENLTIGVFGGVETSGLYDRKKCVVIGSQVANTLEIEALVMPKPSTHHLPRRSQALRKYMENLKQKGYILGNQYDDESAKLSVGLLIGIDYYWKIITGENERIAESVVAVETIFGWALTGQVEKDGRPECKHISCHNLSATECKMTSEEKLDALWKFEALDMQDLDIQHTDEKAFKQRFDNSTKYANKRYSVDLPWRQGMKEQVQSNFDNAFYRLKSTVNKLKSDPVKFDDYAKNIEAYVNNGHASNVEYKNLEEERNKGCFIPHLGVYSETKSTKTRIVFDASSRPVGQLALNDCIDAGPDRALDVISMIHRFRSNKWALIGDIRKAFLQIELNEADREYVKFLWIDRNLPENEWFVKPKIIKMSRVLFGVSASPTLLRYTIRKHAEKYMENLPEIAEVLHSSLYVDDIITGTNDENKLEKLKTDLVSVLEEASMPLHKLRTNHPVDKSWNDETNEGAENDIAVLGLHWDRAQDHLVVRVPEEMVAPIKKLTKRTIISKASSWFDPLGWIAPLLIRIKMLFQLMWTIGLKWDDEVTPEIRQRWFAWINLISQNIEWRLPRYIWEKHQDCKTELHIFSDASPRAYGAVAYLITQNTNSVRQSHLLQSKFRVAPIHQISIPRLELAAALIASELYEYLLQHLNFNIDKFKLWCDSKIVLFWITKYKPRSATFVNNRIAKINLLTPASAWDYCPSEDNPADLATKNNKQHPLLGDSIWWSGPVWLKDYEETWRKRHLEFSENEHIINCSLINTTYPTRVPPVEEDITGLIDYQQFDTFHDVLEATVSKYVQLQSINPNQPERIDLLQKAELWWVRSIQREYFPEEWSRLKREKKLHATSKIRNLHPRLNQNQVLVMQTRLNNSQFDLDWYQPCILPGEHPLVKMLIKDCHQTNLHAGVSTMLLKLRERYWIINLRCQVKKCISECTTCAIYRKKHYTQPVAPLPSFRSADVAPFVHTGLDFAGPIYLYLGKVTVKNYIALFTCSTTRGIHLELVRSLSTDDFLLALKRFVSRRGVPSVIYSDNATNFKSTSRQLRSNIHLQDDYNVDSYLASNLIQWRHIVEDAPWWGGHWERMIRSIKDPLRKSLGKTTLDTENFCTLLTEVEAVINSRPLMIMYDSPEHFMPITPAELMLGRTLTRIELTMGDRNKDVGQIYEVRSRFFKSFMFMWKKLYMGQLRSLHVYQDEQPTFPQLGDVVVIDEAPVKTQLWPLAKIIEVHPSKDGLVRSCTVKTEDGRLLRRAVQRLVPLPVHDVDESIGPAGSIEKK